MKFGLTKRKLDPIVAVLDVGDESVGVALMRAGEQTEILGAARTEIPLSHLSGKRLARLITEEFAQATRFAIARHLVNEDHMAPATQVHVFVGAPWVHSRPAHASTRFDTPRVVDDALIRTLARGMLDTSNVKKNTLLEAHLHRILLDGKGTEEAEGVAASSLDLHALVSDCDPSFRGKAQEALELLFPHASIAWHPRARAILSALAPRQDLEACVVVDVGRGTSDVFVMREGLLSSHRVIPYGLHSLLTQLAGNRPVEETIALLDMVERGASDERAREQVREKIARTEPPLARAVAQEFVPLTSTGRLPSQLLLIAPQGYASLFDRFFSRIEFSPLTDHERPFAVRILEHPSAEAENPLAVPHDLRLSLCTLLVNNELLDA